MTVVSPPYELARSRGERERLGDMPNVKDYGALGDGVADDTVAIKNALAQCAGRSLFFPAGTYLCGNVQVYSGTRLVGVPGSSILMAPTTLADDAGIFENPNGGSYTDDSISLDGLTFDGANLNTTTRTNGLVVFNRTIRLRVRRCTFKNSGYIGLALGYTTESRIEGCHFTNCGKTAGSERGAALWTGDTPGTTELVVANCTFKQNKWSGLYLFATRATITGNKFYFNGESAIFGGGNFVTITGNVIYGTALKVVSCHGIEIGGSYITINGNVIAQCDGSAITVTDTVDVTISGNYLVNASQNTVGAYGTIGVYSLSTGINGLTIVGNTFRDVGGHANGAITDAVGAVHWANVLIANNNMQGSWTVKAMNLQTANWTATCKRHANVGTADAEAFQFDRVQCPAAPGDLAVTGVGFRPRLLEFEAVKDSAALATVGTSRTDGTKYRKNLVAAAAAAGRGTTDATATAIMVMDSAGTVIAQATLTSLDADGFTLAFDVVDAGVYITWKAYP